MKASEMLMPDSFGQTDRLVGIATELGAGVYLSGNGAIKYLDIKRFERCDIELSLVLITRQNTRKKLRPLYQV